MADIYNVIPYYEKTVDVRVVSPLPDFKGAPDVCQSSRGWSEGASGW